MKAGEVKKQTSRNSRINLSHTLEGKNLNQLTTIQLHVNIQQGTSVYYNRGASNLVMLKKSRNQLAVTLEQT